MRLVGIIAVFVLALAAIVEGAFLVRLSGQVADLKEEMRLPGRSPIEESDPAALAARSASATLAAERAAARKAPVPRLEATAAPAAPTGGESSPPATEVLRGALSTAEGREHLNKALQTIREEARQADMIKDIAGDQEREKNYRERLSRTLGLSPSEQGSIGFAPCEPAFEPAARPGRDALGSQERGAGRRRDRQAGGQYGEVDRGSDRRAPDAADARSPARRAAAATADAAAARAGWTGGSPARPARAAAELSSGA